MLCDTCGTPLRRVSTPGCQAGYARRVRAGGWRPRAVARRSRRNGTASRMNISELPLQHLRRDSDIDRRTRRMIREERAAAGVELVYRGSKRHFLTRRLETERRIVRGGTAAEEPK